MKTENVNVQDVCSKSFVYTSKNVARIDFCLVLFGGKERNKWYRGRNVTTGICEEYARNGGLTTHAAQGIGFAGPGYKPRQSPALEPSTDPNEKPLKRTSPINRTRNLYLYV